MKSLVLTTATIERNDVLRTYVVTATVNDADTFCEDVTLLSVESESGSLLHLCDFTDAERALFEEACGQVAWSQLESARQIVTKTMTEFAREIA